MKLPSSAADVNPEDVKNEDAVFRNPYIGKKELTKTEALDAANILIGMVLLHERIEGSKREHP